MFLSSSPLTSRNLASESFDQCHEIVPFSPRSVGLLGVNNPPWSHRVKICICFCGFFSIVLTSTQVRERLGEVVFWIVKLFSITVALKPEWQPGFLDSVASSYKSFLFSDSDLRPHQVHA